MEAILLLKSKTRPVSADEPSGSFPGGDSGKHSHVKEGRVEVDS